MKISGRHGPDAQHPPPAEGRVPSVVAAALDHLVDEQREENADDDSQLKERPQAAAPFLRRQLGDVDRADHRRGPDAQPADEPRDEERIEVRREGGEEKDGRQAVQDGAEEQHPLAAEAIAEHAREHGPRNTAQDGAGADEALLESERSQCALM